MDPHRLPCVIRIAHSPPLAVHKILRLGCSACYREGAEAQRGWLAWLTHGTPMNQPLGPSLGQKEKPPCRPSSQDESECQACWGGKLHPRLPQRQASQAGSLSCCLDSSDLGLWRLRQRRGGSHAIIYSTIFFYFLYFFWRGFFFLVSKTIH